MAATPKVLSDEKAAKILVGLREGSTPSQLRVRRSLLQASIETHCEYKREALPLMEANAKAARLRKGAHIRNRTRCANGHSFAEHARVAMHKGWMTRQCRACELMRYRRGGVMKLEVLKKVTARIAAGSSLNSFTTAGQSGYLLKFSTLARYRRENPEFDGFVVEAIGRRFYRDRSEIAAGTFHYEWDPADLQAIPAMLPDYFPGRDDVVQSIFADLLEGRLDRSQLKQHLRRFLVAYNRQHPGKYAKFGNSPLVSLEEVLFDGGSTTRGDTISRGLWD